MNNKTITNNQFLSQLILLIFFSISSFFVPNNYDLVLPIMLFGTLFIYLFSPTVSFLYSFIFVIDPMATFKLSAISIIPLFLCFLYIIFNIKKTLIIISEDKYLKKIIKLCLLFTFYQVIVSMLLLSEQDIYYLFKNVRYWLGIWILIPSYILTILDRKFFFISIIFLVLLIMIFYYITFFGYYNFFEIREFKRSENDDLMRFFSFDLRQITKFFVYLIPLFLFFPIKNIKLKYTVLLIGILVYVSVIMAILRTEIIYLFLGALLAFFISLKQIKAISVFNSLFIGIACGILILFFFPSIIEPLLHTINIFDSTNLVYDNSADHRLNFQLPLLIKIIKSNLLFGSGTYSVSYEATGHHLLYDIPIIGAIGAYGIIGMLIYYSRFIIIVLRYKTIRMTQKLFNQYPVEFLIVNGLLAYFITMISFRSLHINIELAFDFGMAEFGLFIGIYFALIKILTERDKSNLNKTIQYNEKTNSRFR